MIGIQYIENEYILPLMNIKQIRHVRVFSPFSFFSREIPLTLKHQSVENIHQYISHSWRLQIKNKIYRIETLYMYTLNTYLYNNVHTLILYMKVIIHIFHSTSFGPCENALGYAGQANKFCLQIMQRVSFYEIYCTFHTLYLQFYPGSPRKRLLQNEHLNRNT